MALLYGQKKCDDCDQPAFLSNSKIPRAIYRVFSLESRVRSWYGNKERAQLLRYRHQYRNLGGLKDVFDGALYRDLKQMGHFADELDIALMVAADGVRIFEKLVIMIGIFRYLHSSCPRCLFSLDYPTENPIASSPYLQ
jgi:hypothetical protein